MCKSLVISLSPFTQKVWSFNEKVFDRTGSNVLTWSSSILSCRYNHEEGLAINSDIAQVFPYDIIDILLARVGFRYFDWRFVIISGILTGQLIFISSYHGSIKSDLMSERNLFQEMTYQSMVTLAHWSNLCYLK